MIYDLTFYDLFSMINLTNMYTLVLTRIRKLSSVFLILWLCSESVLSALLRHSILDLRLMNDKDRMMQ